MVLKTGTRLSTWPEGNYGDTYEEKSNLLGKHRHDIWFNLDDVIKVDANGHLSYSMTGLQEHLSDPKIGGLRVLEFVNFSAETYDSWHARLMPPRRSETLITEFHIKTLHRTALDAEPALAVPAYVRISNEKRQVSLIRFGKGFEIELDKYMAPGGQAEADDKIAILASAVVITMKIQVLGALVNTRNRYRAYNAIFPNRSDAAVRAEVEREDARLQGILAKDEKALYKLREHAVGRMRSENATPNMAVFPYNSLSMYAFQDYETEAFRRGEAKVQERLTGGARSLTREFAGLTIYEDDQINVQAVDAELIEFLNERVAIGQFYVMSGAPFERFAGKPEFDATSMLTHLYHNVVHGDTKRPFTFEQGLRASMRFDESGQLDSFHDKLAAAAHQYAYRDPRTGEEVVDPFIHKNVLAGGDAVWERVRVLGDISVSAWPLVKMVRSVKQLAFNARLGATDGTALRDGEALLDELANPPSEVLASADFQGYTAAVAASPTGPYGVPVWPAGQPAERVPYGYASLNHARELLRSARTSNTWVQTNEAKLRAYVRAQEQLFGEARRQFESRSRQAGTGSAIAAHPLLTSVGAFGERASGRVRLPVYIQPAAGSEAVQAERAARGGIDAAAIANRLLSANAAAGVRDRVASAIANQQFAAQLSQWTPAQVAAFANITAAELHPVARLYAERKGIAAETDAARTDAVLSVVTASGDDAASVKLAALLLQAVSGATDGATIVRAVDRSRAVQQGLGAPPARYSEEELLQQVGDSAGYQRTGLVFDGAVFVDPATGKLTDAGALRPADPRQPSRPLVDNEAVASLARAHASSASAFVGYAGLPVADTVAVGVESEEAAARREARARLAPLPSSNYARRAEFLEDVLQTDAELALGRVLLAAPVTLDTLLALTDTTRGNTLPPVTLLVLQPWNVFDMHAVLWAQAGDGGDVTGETVYAYEHMGVQPDNTHKYISGHLTTWLGAWALKEERIYFTPRVGFRRYWSGLDGRVFERPEQVHAVIEDPHSVLWPSDGQSFVPSGFVALCGASTEPQTLVEPLYVTGKFDEHRYPGTQLRADDNAVPQYDSAAYYRVLLGLDYLNANAAPVATTFAEYKQSAVLNTAMYQGDQYIWNAQQKGYVPGYSSSNSPLPQHLPDGARAIFEGQATAPELARRQATFGAAPIVVY
jgi:hypothetical protein